MCVVMAEKKIHTKRRLPPTYFNLAWISMGIVYLLIPGPKIIFFPFTLTGILLLLLGLWMNLWASNHFKKVNTWIHICEFSTSKDILLAGMTTDSHTTGTIIGLSLLTRDILDWFLKTSGIRGIRARLLDIPQTVFCEEWFRREKSFTSAYPTSQT